MKIWLSFQKFESGELAVTFHYTAFTKACVTRTQIHYKTENQSPERHVISCLLPTDFISTGSMTIDVLRQYELESEITQNI